MHRREFLGVTLSSAATLLLSGCEKKYARPKEEFALGKVQDLLEPVIELPGKALIVYLDTGGWSVMSTRCTVEGCTLSYHVENFICSCCRSVFTLRGQVVSGSAVDPLPWYEIKLANGSLYAEAGKDVGPAYRFTHPDLAKVMENVPALLEAAKVKDPATIPNILQGRGDREIGRMFIENQPDDYFDAQREEDRKLLRDQPKKN